MLTRKQETKDGAAERRAAIEAKQRENTTARGNIGAEMLAVLRQEHAALGREDAAGAAKAHVAADMLAVKAGRLAGESDALRDALDWAKVSATEEEIVSLQARLDAANKTARALKADSPGEEVSAADARCAWLKREIDEKQRIVSQLARGLQEIRETPRNVDASQPSTWPGAAHESARLAEASWRAAAERARASAHFDYGNVSGSLAA